MALSAEDLQQVKEVVAEVLGTMVRSEGRGDGGVDLYIGLDEDLRALFNVGKTDLAVQIQQLRELRKLPKATA